MEPQMHADEPEINEEGETERGQGSAARSSGVNLCCCFKNILKS
jgi:hypothetical protein